MNHLTRDIHWGEKLWNSKQLQIKEMNPVGDHHGWRRARSPAAGNVRLLTCVEKDTTQGRSGKQTL